ncbi:MAG: YqcC family protein [Cellvibrionaceae bacterium]|nr:YqcC family protein [Cellvibrionaceae bacterium]
MNKQRAAIAVLLFKLETELRELQLWQNQPPSKEALASTQPFCLDTLELHQWLQFVFIKRISQLLDSGGALPNRCDITPYAEEYWPSSDSSFESLLSCLRQLDAAFVDNG